ncbi:MAG: hypothetical protein ACLFVI_00065 [Archaeoglobaceae archaeon]
MFKRLFGKKKEPEPEVISLDDLDKRLSELLESNEGDISAFISEKKPELDEQIKNLISELENFDSSNLHPRLKGVATSFKSSFLDLWKNVNTENFEEVEKAMNKTANMKVKHFRILFAFEPPEIEDINHYLSGIASIINEVDEKRNSMDTHNVREMRYEIKELKKLLNEREALRREVNKLSTEVDTIEQSKDESEEARQNEELDRLEREAKQIDEKIQHKEKEVQRRIAIARKPLKTYAHMTGRKVKLDTSDFNDEQMTSMASNTITEVVKGNIKVKKKQEKSIIDSLKGISEGEVKKELEEIGKLKEQLSEIKDNIKKMKIKMGGDKSDDRKRSLEKERESTEDKANKIEEKIANTRESLEDRASEVLGYPVKIEQKGL